MVWTGFFPLFHWAGSAIQAAFDLALHHWSWRQLRATACIFAATAARLGLDVLGRLPVLRRWLAVCASPGALSCRLKSGEQVRFWDVLRICYVYNSLLKSGEQVRFWDVLR